ncbi:MAG: hypothetical protein A2235_06185 [Deltaproteobacteria bacterium RIFOXYA2_FULL_42_10]|nr:MAG: hypothetical protein A2235_06185 [Deltaproteobacteria bacterium RIFOXYA2_FULL_42_10]
MSMQKKVIAAILIAGFIALSTGLSITYFEVRDVLIEAIGRDFAEIAKKTAERFDAAAKGEIIALQRLAADPEFIAAVRGNRGKEVEVYLKNFLRYAEVKEDHLGLLVANREGRVIAHLSQKFNYDGDQSSELWWEVTYSEGKGKIYASGIHLDALSGSRVFDIGIPVLDPVTYQVAGGIRSIINADLFFSFVNEMNFGRTGHGMLVDSNGTPLICSILALVEHSMNQPLITQITRPGINWAIARDDAHGGRDSVVGFSPVKFMNSLGPENLNGHKWYTFVRQDPKETFAPVNRVILGVFLFESAMVLIISVLGFFIANRLLIQPVTLLHKGIDRIGKGDFDYKVDIRTGDELESLANVFNRMGDTLKGLYDNLEERIKDRTTELEKTKNYLESIMRNSSDAIITTDLDGRIVTFNEGAERILGYKMGEVIGTGMADYYYQREERGKLLDMIKREGMVSNYETRLVRKGGRIIDISLSLSLLRDENGREIGAVGISKDITEWTRAQEQLREYSHKLESMVTQRTLELVDSKSRLEAMLSGIADGIIFANQENKITFMNEAAEEIFNMKREELLGRDFKDCHSLESHEKSIELIKDMREGKIKSYAAEFKSGDKTVFAHFSPIMHGPEYLGVIFIAKDVTEMKRLQEELVKTEKLALIGKMSSTIAHELRNPLVPIGGFARLIYRKAEQGSPFKMYADLIIKEIDRLEELFHDFLGFAKEVKPVFQPIHLNQIIEELLLLYKDTFGEKNIRVNSLISVEMPPTSLDPMLIRQTFINMFNNAIQAMPDGGTLTIETKIKEKNGKRYASVSIGDTGMGIPEEVKQYIFEPFYTTKIHGLGLGLSVAKGIVESHGGEIEVKSIKNIGTIFTITLPVEKRAET